MLREWSDRERHPLTTGERLLIASAALGMLSFVVGALLQGLAWIR